MLEELFMCCVYFPGNSLSSDVQKLKKKITLVVENRNYVYFSSTVCSSVRDFIGPWAAVTLLTRFIVQSFLFVCKLHPVKCKFISITTRYIHLFFFLQIFRYPILSMRNLILIVTFKKSLVLIIKLIESTWSFLTINKQATLWVWWNM